MSDGTVHVARLSDYDGSIICGVYTTLDDAIDCLYRSDEAKRYRMAIVDRIPLDCDFDDMAVAPVFCKSVPELLSSRAASCPRRDERE